MADRVPLRLVNVNGTVTIGEFQSGDTVGVVHGGTGVSSIADLKDSLNYNLSALDDVSVGSPDALLANQIIVWNGNNWVNEYNDKTEMRVRNGTASAMSKGDVIAIEDAHNANLVNVILADASQTSAMPALGILEQDLAVGEEGIAITFGKAQGLNTLGLTEGATAYVSPTTPGGVTTTKPTGGSELIQNIGIVMRANASNGAIKVTGIGRTNDIPNAEITTLSGDADYIYIDDGGVWKKITPTNLGVGTGGGSASLSGLTDTNISTPSHNEALVWTSSTGEWINASLAGGGGVTDHGLLTGLSDNDHPQYLLSSTYSDVSAFFPSITRMPAINSSFSAMPAWTEGTDDQGSYWLNVSHNDPDESVREYRPDPFNGSSIVWVAKDLEVVAQAYDGGFDTSNVPIDAAYTYRISGFVKQHTPTSGSNYFSFGPMHNFSSDPTKAVAIVTNGSIETNPRFRSFHDMPTYDEWYLVVGHVQASSTTIPGTKHENTGVWDLDGNLTSTSYNDFVFSSTTTQMGCRFQQFNNPNGTGDSIEFFDARIDKIDGNEPSIKDLLKLFTTQHSQLDGLADDDHTQYIIEDPTTSGRNTIIPTGDFPGLIIQSTSANTGGLFTIKDDAGDDLFEVTVDGQVEIPRQTSYGVRHPNDGTFYPLVGLDSANDRVFGDLISNTGKRVHIQNSTGDISFESNDDDIIFRNGPLNGEVLRVKSDGSLTPSGSNLLVSGGGSFTGDVIANSQSVSGHIASGSVHFTEASIDHGSIAGLADNDHPQYVLSATNQALSSLVTNVEGSTVSLSSYIAANETTWSTDNDTTDHTALSNIGTNTHAQIDTHIADSTIHFTEASIDHTNISNIGTNTHAQIDTHISNHTTSANTWNGTYHTVFDNSGSWGGGATDHGALGGLSDDDHTQYARVDGTRNLQTQTISDTYTGTIGDTSIGYGIETTGNLTNKAGNYLLLSSTTGYQFRSPTVTFTDTDFPTTLGRIPSFKDSGILIKNTGTDNIDGTGAVVPMDAEELSYGAAATDYSYTAGNAYVTINTAGTYEVTVSVGYTSTVQRWNGRLEIYTNSSGGTPNTWIGYGSSKMGYLRSASGHNEASLIITLPVTVTAGTTIAGWVEREAASGTCNLVANETYMSIKRLD